jgi:hypothetical protein
MKRQRYRVVRSKYRKKKREGEKGKIKRREREKKIKGQRRQ